MTEIPLLCRNGNTPIMIDDMILLNVGLSAKNEVVSFSLPPHVVVPADPPTVADAYMTFNDDTSSNCAEFDFMGHGRDCYEGQPIDARCGIVKQQLMSRPAIQYEYRFKIAVPDPNLRQAISNAINSTHNVTYGAFGWPCKAEGITELHAENMGIALLDGIENLTGLTKLWLDGNPFVWVAPLRLPNPLPLKELHLANCTQIQGNAAGLRFLTTLEILDLSGCTPITDLTNTLYGNNASQRLNNLCVLNISGCTGLYETFEGSELEFSSISVLKNLESLHVLDLSCCPGITDLSPVRDNPNFKKQGSTNSDAKLHLSNTVTYLSGPLADLANAGVQISYDDGSCNWTPMPECPTPP